MHYQALAAVGSTTMITNMFVFFFNGFATGAGVVISRNFGARKLKELHDTIETTMAMTFLLCAIFTITGVLGVKWMLRFMSTPDDVFSDATIYLTIYLTGISGLLIYNIGSGILRAVGDTTRPLMFLVLIVHYGKIGISILSISMAVLCLFGATFGLWLFGYDFSITATLGLISLVGIIVRNAIIMYDYVAELRSKEQMSVSDAAYHAGLRRMRPIFLTSATTALGVIPMITAGTLLWAPMGVVVCFGTIFTLPLVVTILPVAYCVAFENKKRVNHRPIKLK